jgi:hypothetical protein
MSQALPYWDDAPQPQSPTRSHIYTEEEAQELVEKAYQEGWQQGMEDGYKLGKDKGYKEYKVQEEEEEAKKAKNQANQAAAIYQDTRDVPCIDPRVNTTPKMYAAAPKACASAKTTHNPNPNPTKSYLRCNQAPGITFSNP